MLPFDVKSHRRFEEPLTLLPRILTKLYSMWLSTTYPFASKGSHLSIHFTSDFYRPKAHRIKLGSSVTISKDTWFNVTVAPEEIGEPMIIIDDDCCIGPRCWISAKNCIHLEHDVMVAPSVLIMDHSHSYEDIALPIRDQGATEGGRIRIMQGCWIGQGAAIVCSRGELVLGRNCVVAANSLVSRSFPANSVIAGNPARVVKQFDPEKRAWVMRVSRRPDRQ